ncbi:MAG TPA: phosphoglucosamine mutase [Myxococcota bacterium]|nr:phosphoglucosamine mutase [Myxococcota bacterium]HQK50421.1 phosphoglucosamine mutase [Myxococcota bacterium]
MAERRLFGTDGIRGVANVAPMTPDMALALGKAAAAMFAGRKGRKRILIGKDTRLSGYMFETAMAAGIVSTGADVLLSGPIPTPGIAYLTVGMRADAGVVISASHNPFEDNGIKFFGADGFKLPDEVEARIERLMDHPEELPPPATGKDFGRAHRIDDAVGRYCVHLKSTFPRHLSLTGLRIAVDCAHGAAYRVAPLVFEELGAEVVLLGAAPDGTNINENCGALHPEMLARKVLEHRCDLGLALDGDGDRAILVDERGEVVDGDAILALCAVHMNRHGALKGGGVVGTVMSNFGLELALQQMGLRLVRTDVGDRYVVEEMTRGGYNLGGEQSGHLLFLDHATTGDGILSALRVLEVMLLEDRRLSDLASSFQRFPQVVLSGKVREKPPLETLGRVQAVCREAEATLAGRGRVNVRYSGTSALIRVMVEGEDKGIVEEWARRILEAAGEDGILA